MNAGIVFEDKELQALVTHFVLPLKQKNTPSSQLKRVIVIAGPTSVGKSSLSLQLAAILGGEIVSADSMQVYREMDIGTAKVSKEIREKIPHHLIDICDLGESFNVVDFYYAAYRAIHEIFDKGKVPIVVGGTGFYLRALLYGPPSGPSSVPEVREHLENEMRDKGAAFLYERLLSLDPHYAATITQNDRHKIVRALEIISLTNKQASQFAKTFHPEQESYNFRCWFLYMPKEVLYPRIEMRCDQMIAQGFIEEVRALEHKGLRANLSASQAIGYRQCLEFLRTAQTQQDWDHFIASFKQASRRYAKRQFTWFRKETLFRWLDIEHLPTQTLIETLIQDYEHGG